MTSVKACIFDLDGVVVDTAIFHYQAWKRLADELGIKGFTEEENENLKGVSRQRSLEIILEIGGITFDQMTKDELTEKKNGWYVELISKMTPEDILPGVKHFFNELQRKGIKLGLASASKNARRILGRVGIESYFEAIVDGNRISKAKPSPEVFLLCAQDLQVDPVDCVVFEDAKAGIEAAKNGGMFSIGVGSSSILGEADFVISSFDEMNINRLQFYGTK
ncbi:MAG: beta-phosphoglucomutase [Bacteroidetes bacterium]|nr:beta-phosphoglucomutase [Bacteroidota bacterium]